MAFRFPRNVRDQLPLKGFFTQALFLRQQSTSELERRLGYRSGRLEDGYWLLFLKQKPTIHQFEFRGYSQMSGGIPKGHKPENAGNPNAEQSLEAQGANLVGTPYQKEGLKQKAIAQTFQLMGPKRLAKIMPIARAVSEDGVPDYPPGSGIPQWELTVELPWVAAAFIGNGEKYEGMYQL